jgi:hypothetical protein
MFTKWKEPADAAGSPRRSKFRSTRPFCLAWLLDEPTWRVEQQQSFGVLPVTWFAWAKLPSLPFGRVSASIACGDLPTWLSVLAKYVSAQLLTCFASADNSCLPF